MRAVNPPSQSDIPGEQLPQRLAELKGQLDDLRRRLPAHSAPPSMVAQMEDLEDEVARLERRLVSLGDSEA